MINGAEASFQSHNVSILKEIESFIELTAETGYKKIDLIW